MCVPSKVSPVAMAAASGSRHNNGTRCAIRYSGRRALRPLGTRHSGAMISFEDSFDPPIHYRIGYGVVFEIAVPDTNVTLSLDESAYLKEKSPAACPYDIPDGRRSLDGRSTNRRFAGGTSPATTIRVTLSRAAGQPGGLRL